MARSISEPGTVKAFEYADLYGKVSGYLEVQNVDIGDAVKKGNLLAKIFSPELVEAVEQAKAHLQQAKAQVKLAEAGIERANADLKAANANVIEKEADLRRETAYLAFRQIEYERIQHLYDLKAIEEKLVDQNLKDRDAALEAKNAAKAAIESAKAEVTAKQAKVVEAVANVTNAKAKVQLSAAELAKAKVFQEYLEIRSPYTGVVTKRTYHVGDFIRAAEQGSGTPLLIVARTDKMRVEMKMPEAYVPYTDPGDPATVELDALTGNEYHAKVSRIGNSLDPNDRTMRVEVDLDNKNNELRDGMFGRVTVQLTRSSKEVSVPSTCLVSGVEGTTTSVYVVKDGEARLRTVKVGRDSGVQAEIISGLKPDQLVVLHPTADLVDGQAVDPVEIKNANAPPKRQND
ncbi:MAG TPA: efflux RND transporter periplasmic adaptor subunit [Planctomycetaceae bacterium]|jgi:RND family efflux transporter MFP subunit|nr:efflux RND transporter periplasmic adaptor subunit [Planctomycetaceae bacterium]